MSSKESIVVLFNRSALVDTRQTTILYKITTGEVVAAAATVSSLSRMVCETQTDYLLAPIVGGK